MKHYLLDSSFLIDLFNEYAAGKPGPAGQWLWRNRRAHLWISPVTYAEVMEGAVDPDAVRKQLSRYRWQAIGQRQAEKVASLQRRSTKRMGENDAWQAAVAASMNGIVLGHDPAAFSRLGAGYEDHRGSHPPRG